jgi:hypothetical protein
VDYWLNRYQTLITGAAALVAAWVTVRAMRQQIESTRVDAADRALTSYAIALFDVMEKYHAATPPDDKETLDDALKRFSTLRDATDEPMMKAAMMDGILGEDQPAVPQFVSCCRFSAVNRIYSKDDQPRHTNMVWPLYIALSNGILRRKAMLREAARVSDLYTLSRIDHAELATAFSECRVPRIV